MMAPCAALTALAFGASLVAGSVTIRKTGTAPTGYEVDFKYTNASANRILIGGGLQPFTDQFHTTMRSSALYNPKDYKAGDFYIATFPPEDYVWPYEMVSSSDESGEWTFTTPLPSGVYSFAYLVDCDYAPRCTIDTGKLFVDPELPPFRNTEEDQVASTFQVPFDPVFQLTTDATPVDFDYGLSAPEGERGTVKTVNYTSPGSIHPAPDVHDFSIYLPAEYGTVPDKKYPLLYMSHGAGGNGADWENLGRASAILDNLIREGHIEPTVVVMPSFYNLDASLPKFVYGDATNRAPPPSAQHVRENYVEYLFPWVESHYEVCDEPKCRAFSGLSLGGRLTYEMYVNATDLFAYYGFFSPAASAPFVDAAVVAANPGLAEKGLFVGYGLYDSVFDLARGLQGAFDGLDFEYISRVAPYGSHYWPTWQDNLWWFGVTALWKPIPFTQETGR